MSTTAELSEALTAAGVSALVQKVIDPMLLEYQRRYSPLMRIVPSKYWPATRYNFNRRTTRVQGGFVVDGGARPVGASTYLQDGFDMKNLQAVGAVTGYAQEVTKSLIGDLRRQEIESAIQGLMWDIECAMNWGSADATAFGPYPQFTGLHNLEQTFSGSNQNVLDGGGSSMSDGWLDALIDMVESNQAAPVDGSRYFFEMSPTANSKIAQLFTQNQRFVNQMEVAPGLMVATYRDIPIIKSSFLSARAQTFPTVTATPSAVGGTLPAGQYFYRVSAIVSRFGMLVASAEVNVTTTGSTGAVQLAFPPVTGPEGGLPLTYEVYRSNASGTETRLGIVDAIVGLTGDGVTPILATSLVDNGTQLIPQNGAMVPAQTPATYVGGNNAQKPRNAGTEEIHLAPRDPDVMLRPYVRDIKPVDVYATTASPDSLPFALVSDTTLALRAPKYVGRLENVVSALSTAVRTSQM